MAHYTRFKVKKGSEVNALDFMPHEDRPKPLTFEEERMQAKRKSESL